MARAKLRRLDDRRIRRVPSLSTVLLSFRFEAGGAQEAWKKATGAFRHAGLPGQKQFPHWVEGGPDAMNTPCSTYSCPSVVVSRTPL